MCAERAEGWWHDFVGPADHGLMPSNIIYTSDLLRDCVLLRCNLYACLRLDEKEHEAFEENIKVQALLSPAFGTEPFRNKLISEGR